MWEGGEQSGLPSFFFFLNLTVFYFTSVFVVQQLLQSWDFSSNKLGRVFGCGFPRLPLVIRVISDFRVLAQIPLPLNHLETQSQKMTSETYVLVWRQNLA